VATEGECDEEANNSSGGDRQGGDRQHRVGEIDRTEIYRMVNRKERVGQLGGIG
jgi:hypothetical protein